MSWPVTSSSYARLGLRCLIGGAVVLFVLFGAPIRGSGQSTNDAATAQDAFTEIQQIWTIPPAERDTPRRIRTELTIYFCDPVWNVSWGECNGIPTFLPLGGTPVHFRSGQRVLIDGWINPRQERVLWDKTRVEIIETNTVFRAVPVTNINLELDALTAKLVELDALVDRILPGDPQHATLSVLVNGTVATAFILTRSNSPPLQVAEGDIVRIKCIYSAQSDRDGKLDQLSLWVDKPEDVVKIGSVDDDPRFDLPISQSRTIEGGDSHRLLHVEGVVRSHEPGKWVTLWDETGQVMVRSRQTRPLRQGDHVEAVGYPFVSGVDNCLDNGIYRPTVSNHIVEPHLVNGVKPVLYLAEEVRDLTPEQAEMHPKVQLRGVITWSSRLTPFVYLQDGSGGILLENPKWDGPNSQTVGTIITVRGEVTQGDFVPVVTNAVISRSGWWNIVGGRGITFEQAMTGLEDCQWVEMQGYVRSVTNFGGLASIDLSGSGGEFKVFTPRAISYDYLQGAFVRVQGVCDAVTDAKHRLTGFQLWSPETKYITVEELAPWDPFELPMRSIGGLRRFNLANANQRVRVSGTVVLHVPGRYLYLQDGDDSLFVLSRGQEPLSPGEKVEVAGLTGTQGRRFLLREAVYRSMGRGVTPVPVNLPPSHSVNADLGGLLARARGTILNVVTKDGQTRMLVQTAESAFEASLLSDSTTNARSIEPGSQVEMTGVYEIQSDDYGKPRSFILRLRSWGDISVLHRPPWWTLKRMILLLLAFVAASAVVLSWALAISRKNSLLNNAQAELQRANDGLEARVQERTRELERQVADKERARAELAEAQKSLMLASRKAGMAEVATGVLHNVGNVLNSVNVSALLLADRIRQSRVENVMKAGELLQKQDGRLAEFLTADPKGKQLPSYLKKLGENLVAEKSELAGEVQALVKYVDHIKVIVGMQQSYAKLGGILEELDLEELVEDAIKINIASLDRHSIQIVRNLQTVPRVTTDRHKIVQILVNLISNAKNALEENAGEKKITISLKQTGPQHVSLTVSDNGVGIPSESLHQIFSQGFTTRKQGHGFGLHSGANAARELGGKLLAHSDGPGKGASFTLEIPLCPRNSAPKPART